MLVTQWQRGVKRIVWPKEVADGQLVLAKEANEANIPRWSMKLL
jgi:hypothetical protein